MRASLCGSSSPDGALFGVPSHSERKSKKKKQKRESMCCLSNSSVKLQLGHLTQ